MKVKHIHAKGKRMIIQTTDSRLFIGGIGLDQMILDDFEEMKFKFNRPLKQVSLGANHLIILDG